MAIAFRAAAVAEVNSSSITITKPTGTVDDDAMVAQIYIESSNNPPTGLSAPSGWVLKQSGLASTNFWFGVYRKVASGEGANYQWSWTGSIYATGIIGSWSGCDTTEPVDTSAFGTSANSGTITYPAVTTSVANTVIVACGASFAGASSAPSTFSTANQPTYSGAMYYKANAASGVYSAFTGSCISGRNIGVTVALKEPGGGGGDPEGRLKGGKLIRGGLLRGGVLAA